MVFESKNGEIALMEEMKGMDVVLPYRENRQIFPKCHIDFSIKSFEFDVKRGWHNILMARYHGVRSVRYGSK